MKNDARKLPDHLLSHHLLFSSGVNYYGSLSSDISKTQRNEYIVKTIDILNKRKAVQYATKLWSSSTIELK